MLFENIQTTPLLDVVISTRLTGLESGLVQQIVTNVNRERTPGTREISGAAVIRALLLEGIKVYQKDRLANEGKPSPALRRQWESGEGQ
jgi:hypothetical protein